MTNNLKDFPKDVLRQHEIEVQSADVFLSHLFDLSPLAFCHAVKQQRARLKNPNHTVEELLAIFYNQGLPMTVNKLKDVIDLL
ncbi:MAG TPA: hypothetical protein ENG96_02745 [Gammaproteobacteria bacterium]|nr:hypothetical protein [Gammaproteobacteria bacterium]